MDAIDPWHFDPSGAAWVQGVGKAPIHRTSTLTLATFNVWFGEHESQARTNAMLGLLRKSEADVIALQEVTPGFLQRICSEDWVRREFFLSDVNGTTISRYGTLLLSRLPVRVFEIHELPTMMGRTLLLVRVDLGSQELVVGCVHLESLQESAWYREEQLRLIFEILDPEENAVVMGDFNFCSSWQENALMDERYSDLWPLAHPDAPGWTVDTKANRMRQVLGKSNKSVRFDRILLRAKPALLKLHSMDLLGNGPISPDRPDLYPSDHFGLVASFKVALLAPK